MQRKTTFNDDWKFRRGDAIGREANGFDDSAWRSLHLPHDWSIEGPFNEKNPGSTQMGYLPGGTGWYRKRFPTPPGLQRSGESEKRRFVRFDGIYRNSEVWINGHFLGRRPYGFIGFQYDLTPFLNDAEENVLAVRVENEVQPNCRWYTGSGINRNVWLITVDALHVDLWGTYITTPVVESGLCQVHFQTSVRNDSAEKRDFLLETVILDRQNREVGLCKSAGTVAGGGLVEIVQDVEVRQPNLWSVDSPYLYRACSTITNSADGLETDRHETSFGIRTLKFDSDRGFLLNGQQVKMKGVCLHDDGGNLGTAVPKSVWQRRLDALKSMGCNAIRGSHNPKAPEFLDLCDQMGFLVIDEAFDKWIDALPGYSEDFLSWWKADLDAFIRRDRNHPSVILWSVGNEVAEQNKKWGYRILRCLVNEVKMLDPTRPVTCGLRPQFGEDRETATGPFAGECDIVALNYQEPWYESDHAKYPERLIIGSESFAYWKGGTADLEQLYEENNWFDVVKHNYVLGQFLWSGIDYMGETPGWPCKGWTGAPIDRCGFRKPRSYFHQSVWSEKPMVHIAVFDDAAQFPPVKAQWDWPKIVSHWNFPGQEGKKLRLVTYTNCDEVELFINGQSYGAQQLAGRKNLMIMWEAEYFAGEIRAVGKNHGKAMCDYLLRTAGEPSQVVLVPDRTSVSTGGDEVPGADIIHIEVFVADESGAVCPFSTHRLLFDVDGPGVLKCLDNGDMMSGELFSLPEINVYQGRGLAIVEVEALREAESGAASAYSDTRAIRISAKAEGLDPGTCEVRIV